MKSYTEFKNKIISGEELTESERDYFEDIIDEIENKVKKFKARIFVALNNKRYYVYDDFYAYVELYNWASDDYEDDGIILGHKYVDLGLSVKWATCNVGATEPWEYGGYFAWGETEEKSDYSWETYRWCNGSENTMTKYCTNSYFGRVDNKILLEPEDDVAHVKWGGSWRMPTHEEQMELLERCNWEWTELNGVYGNKVTGPNGNSIFLPAEDNGIFYSAIFWSSSFYDDSCFGAYCLYSSDNIRDWDYPRRYLGCSVRPVSK